MKIMVFGANSYIARNLVQILKRTPDRYELALYDRESEHKEGFLEYQPLNILDYEAVSKLDFACDIVYMFVGRTGTTLNGVI